MLLLTGATGVLGSLVVRRLLAAERPIRCLVGDPRRLGPERVRVQLALGDPGRPVPLRHALRGVTAVVHLAGGMRDQPGRTIEAQNAGSTRRLLRAAEAAGARHFLLLSTLGASERSPSRFCRAKAVAEGAVAGSSLAWTVIAPSLVYAPGARWLTTLERLALLPAVPLPGHGAACVQPIHADDLAAGIVAALRPDASALGRQELAGPDAMSYAAAVRTVLRVRGWTRRTLPVAPALARRALRVVELLGGSWAFATPDELDLVSVDRCSERGSTDTFALGVNPRSLVAGLESG